MTTKESLEIESYITQFDTSIQQRLIDLRNLVLKNVPEAEEKLAYGMIAYYLNKKPLIYFGGFKSHLGLYALPSSHSEFSQKLSSYKQGKGSVQFPHTQALPFDLISEIIIFRVKEVKKSN